MKIKTVPFLRAKIELLAAAHDHAPSGENFRNAFTIHLPAEPDGEQFSNAAARRFDKDIEAFARVTLTSERIAEVHKVLHSKYGIHRLGKSVEEIVKRVEKRGRITDDTEAEIVRAFVSNIENEEQVGRTIFRRLAAILDQAGY